MSAPRRDTTTRERFADVLGPGRGGNHPDVWLVEDHGGYNMGPPVVGVFASRDEQLAEQVAVVHRHHYDDAVITVRKVTYAEYERISDAQADIGPGPVDRVTHPREEADIMGLPWPLPAR